MTLRGSINDTHIAISNSVKSLTEDLADNSTTTGSRDELIAGLDCPGTQTPARPNMTMLCPSCTFGVTCWTMELSEQILDNHQHKMHPGDQDLRRMEEAQRRQDQITHNSRVTEPATNLPVRILDRIREMEARKHLAIEILGKSWSNRDEEIEWTKHIIQMPRQCSQ